MKRDNFLDPKFNHCVFPYLFLNFRFRFEIPLFEQKKNLAEFIETFFLLTSISHDRLQIL